MDLNKLSARAVVNAITARELSVVEVATACLERAAAREPEVGAFEYLNPEYVLEQARLLDTGPVRGPLHGVPIGVKDIIDTIDMPTGLGSSVYGGRRSHWDASCVALSRAAGGVIMGKTVTTEFAYFHPGKTRNPHNLSHTPGGSSMGSAAAVADYMIPIALASQTAASVTRPAAFCGIIGYKPSYGSFDQQGVLGLAASFDTLGLMARDLDDLTLMRSVLAGDNANPAPRPDRDGLRLGFVRTPHWNEADMPTRSLCEACVDKLASGGATVSEPVLPDGFDELSECHATIMAVEASRARAFEYAAYRNEISETFARLIEKGRAISYKQYRKAQDQAAWARRAMDRLFEDVDVLLAPSAVGEAPRGLSGTGDPLFSRMWTLLHVSSVTLPAGRGPQGLPMGVQLIGRRNADSALIVDARWALDRLS